MRRRYNTRPAIAMIELIFALVVIGLVMTAAPRLISVATKSSFVAVQQEAINEAASQLNMLLSYHWDENSADEDFLDPILITDSPVTDLAELNTTANPNTGRRLGTPKESYRTFIREDGKRLKASAKTTFGGADDGVNEKDDIDDFHNTTTNLVLIPESTLVTDNVEKTTIDINTSVDYSLDDTVEGGYNHSTITYNPFNSSSGTITNIKSITSVLTSTSGSSELNTKKITLRAFSCNIGAYRLEEKDL